MLDLPKQKTLKLLVEELSHQENETRKLKLVIWMEKLNSNPTVEQYKFGYDYIRKNLADRDFYYGFKYVDLAAKLLGRETETAPYREAQ